MVKNPREHGADPLAALFFSVCSNEEGRGLSERCLGVFSERQRNGSDLKFQPRQSHAGCRARHSFTETWHFFSFSPLFLGGGGKSSAKRCHPDRGLREMGILSASVPQMNSGTHPRTEQLVFCRKNGGKKGSFECHSPRKMGVKIWGSPVGGGGQNTSCVPLSA